MTKTIGSVILGLCLVVSPALAGPGDLFGGDDTGCVPLGKLEMTCSGVVAKALAKLNASVIKCHLVQEAKAFKTSHSSPGFDHAEENCEQGSNTSANAQFEATLAKYALRCDPALFASARARRDVILADQTNSQSLDALNGSFFCDATSLQTIAEPGGDDAGFVPATDNAQKCSVATAKAYAKLLGDVYHCHLKAALYGLDGRVFDEDACEDGTPPPPLLSARGKYDKVVQHYVTLGICPACVATNAPTLANDAITALDAQNADIFPCP
jgi:hypothetical protein